MTKNTKIIIGVGAAAALIWWWLKKKAEAAQSGENWSTALSQFWGGNNNNQTRPQGTTGTAVSIAPVQEDPWSNVNQSSADFGPWSNLD